MQRHMGKVKIMGFVGEKKEKPSGFIVGKKEFLEQIEAPLNKKVAFPEDIRKTEELIKSLSEKDEVTLLVSGDPLFFSLGEKIARNFPDSVVIPEVSYMQIAFSRIKESWKDASFTSLHGRDMELLLPAIVKAKRFLFVFTSPQNNPGRIADFLLKANLNEDVRMHIFERLNTPKERVQTLSLREAAQKEFAEPNCVILEKLKEYPDIFRDELYQSRKGLLTKGPIRGMILSLLGCGNRKVVWDVGAGSGAVSITLSRNSEFVFAIEKDEESLNILKSNIKTFGAWNVIPIKGEAPSAFEGLKEPDAVFIGAGLKNPEVVEEAYQRLKKRGKLVATFVSPESLKEAFKLAEKLNARMLSVSITEYSGKLPKPRIPVWIMISQKYT